MTVVVPGEETSEDELVREQRYFDRAWDARERSRRTLGGAAAAVGGKASVAVGKAANAYIEQLGDADEAVAIGRFDDSDGLPMYVGRHVVTDDDHEPLVVSWKAPAAARYFTASYEDPQGLALRRTYQLDRNRVLGFEDLVFADLASRVEELTGLERQGIDDNVLRDLDAGRTSEMRDIVKTIHAMQYELVRSPLDQLLVIQGGPGTGKTVVALHRVSWLLFNHREDLAAEDVLVVGPNPTFTRYIRSVLPGLGDSQVGHRDLRTLGLQSSTGRVEDLAVARVKGEARMSSLIAAGIAQRVRFPERSARLDVGPGADPLVSLERPEVEEALRENLTQARSYMAGRASMRSWLARAVSSRVRWGVDVPAQAIDAALERVWPSLSPQAFLRDLLGSRDRLLAAGGQQFTAAEVQLLFRAASDRVSDERWSDTDVALLDEADWLLTGTPPSFRHIVVDEAQDLSPMQLRSVRRRSRSGSYTLVGDLAQSTGAWARDSWDDVTTSLVDQHDVVVTPLTLGYRVPQQIFALAAQLLPHAAPGVEAPQVVRQGPASPDLRQVDAEDAGAEAVRAARDYAARGLFVGIVCPDACRAAVIEALGEAEVQYKDTRSGSLGTSINLVSAQEAKGLEFEAVIVVEPEDIVLESPHGLRLLYVALTRTTKFLTVVHSGRVLPIPAEDDPGALPAVEVLSLEDTRPAPQAAPGQGTPLPGAGSSVTQLPGLQVDGELELDFDGATQQLRSQQPQAPTVSAPAAHADLDDFSSAFARAMAERLADHVASSAQPRLWDAVVAALAEELTRRRGD